MLEPVACVPDSSHHFCWLALGMSSYLPLLRSLICEMGTVLAPSQALRALGTQAGQPWRSDAGTCWACLCPASPAQYSSGLARSWGRWREWLPRPFLPQFTRTGLAMLQSQCRSSNPAWGCFCHVPRVIGGLAELCCMSGTWGDGEAADKLSWRREEHSVKAFSGSPFLP